MAHRLDTNAGQTSFVSARLDAWHQLGTTLENTFTAEDAMKHGLLGGWNTRKVPLVAQALGLQLPVPDAYAVVRDNPVLHGMVDVLGTVGNAYTVIQNEELAGLLNALVDQSGAHFETAGAIDGGRKVFITMKLPSHAMVGGVDRVDYYLAAMTSHDGSTSTTLLATPVRVVCANTLNLAFQRSSHQFRVRHTTGADRILVQEAREALDFTFSYLDGFQQQAEQLINTTLRQDQFDEIIVNAYGPPEGAPNATVTRANNKLEQMSQLFADAYTQQGIRDTAWAGLNALTEWYDHFSPVRGGANASGTEADLRGRKALLDPSFKDKALRLMLAAV